MRSFLRSAYEIKERYADKMTAVPEPSRACLSSRVFENNVLSGERTKSQMIWMSRPQSLLSASKMFSLGSTQDH